MILIMSTNLNIKSIIESIKYNSNIINNYVQKGEINNIVQKLISVMILEMKIINDLQKLHKNISFYK